MKKIFCILLILCMCLAVSGCHFWMDGSYHSVTPHMPEILDSKQDAVTIDSEEQVLSVLTQQIEQGSTSTVIYCRDTDEEALERAMASAVSNLSVNNGIFAYAVDDILYKIGQRNSQMTISVQVSYLHDKQELQKIQQAADMQAATEIIGQALTDCEAGIVLRVKQYADMDVAQFVQDYVDMNPDVCMELPQVTAMLYPDKGEDRVLELTFTYQTSRDALRNMQESVQPVFSSAKNYVNVDADITEQYSQLYAFLMGRDTYTLSTSLTPSYSLLNHGVGDSKALAIVYAAMCRQSELECKVVSGTRDGEVWYWNVVEVNGNYYHLDLYMCSQGDGFQMKTRDQMINYVWDYSAY